MRWPTTLRMIVPVAVVSGLLLVVGITAAWYVHGLNQDVSQRLSDHVTAVLASERLVLELRDVRLDLDRFADMGDPARIDSAVAARREIERSIAELKRTTSEKETTELRNKTCDSVGGFLNELDEFAKRSSNDVQSEDTRQLIRRLSREVLAPAEQLLDAHEQAAATSSQRNETIANRLGLGLLLLGICGAVAGLLAGYGIARGLQRSIVQLSLPVRDMAGQLNELIGPITVASDADLGELDKALQELADKTGEAVKQIQVSQEKQHHQEQLSAVGQLAAGLAHELRNPLMSIKLLVQSAIERNGDQPLSRRDLEVLEDEIARLEKMLQSFLDFARPPQLEKEPHELGDVIERVVEFVRPRAQQQGVRIQCKLAEPLPAAEIDESQLRQVILNLVINSLDAMPGGGNVWINLSLVKNQPHVMITVSDDGPGLPRDIAGRAFEPFASTKETGTGLGLPICRQIVESHGGTITACDAPKRGAKFIIQLPIESSPRATAVPAV